MMRSLFNTAAKGLFSAAVTSASMPLTFGAAAGAVAVAGAYAANRAVQFMGGREGLFPKHQHSIGRFNYSFPMLSRTATNRFVMGGMMLSAGAGVYDGVRARGWDLNQAISTGQLEVERPHFLGATGSLTLSMHRNRKRGILSQPDPNQVVDWGGVSKGMMHAVL